MGNLSNVRCSAEAGASSPEAIALGRDDACAANCRLASVVPKVVVIGCSGHARVVVDIVESEGRSEVIGFLDTFKRATSTVLGYQMLGTEEDLPSLIACRLCNAVIVAVGDNWIRGQIANRIRALVPAVPFISAIHPSAQISRTARIGPGTVIMAGAIVNAGCRIGECCILNTGSSLDHDSTMEPFSSLAPGAVTGGTVTIGAFSAIAIGAVISHAIKIGEHAVVGAGSTIVRNIPDRVVAYGTPARIIRTRNPGDPYLGERSYEVFPSADSSESPEIVRSLRNPRLIAADSADWNGYLERTRHDFFHTAESYRACESVGGGKAFLSIYGDADKFVAWPIMLQDINSPGSCFPPYLKDISSVYGYTGPVTCGCESDSDFLSQAWNEIREMWRSEGAVSAFTRFHPIFENHRFLPSLRDDRVQQAFVHESFAEGRTVAIDLRRTPEQVWQGYARGLRQALRRSFDLGMVVESDPNWLHLNDFIRIYHATMARNGAKPFYFFSREYFQELQKAAGRHGTLLLARIGNEIAGGMLLIEYGGIAHIHLMGSEDEFLPLSPGKLLIHQAQLWARERKNYYLHLGGGRGSKTDDPLFRFKRMFSDLSFPFFTGRWILDAEKYDSLIHELRPISDRSPGTTSVESFFPAYREPL